MNWKKISTQIDQNSYDQVGIKIGREQILKYIREFAFSSKLICLPDVFTKKKKKKKKIKDTANIEI